MSEEEGVFNRIYELQMEYMYEWINNFHID